MTPIPRMHVRICVRVPFHCIYPDIKEAIPRCPVVLGGIEASMRRLTHYDYWQDRVRPSILLDSGADSLIYGMGEKPVVELAEG